MLKSSTSGFEKPLFANLTRFIDLLPTVLEEEALELAIELEEELLLIYNEAPPRSNAKFIWSLDAAANLRAQRWWFRQLRLGNIPTDGSHYKRQNKPPYGGKVLVQKQDGRIVVIVTNTWAKAGLLFGQIDKDTRLPGHKQTGWEWQAPKIKTVRRKFLEQLFNRIEQRQREAGA